MSNLVSLVSMVIALVIAGLLDWVNQLLKQWVSQTFQMTPRLWLGLAADIVLVLSIYGLLWIVLYRFPPARWVGALFIIVGAIFALYLPLMASGPKPLSEILAAPGNPLRSVLMAGGLNSFVILQSVAVLVSGLVVTFRRPQK